MSTPTLEEQKKTAMGFLYRGQLDKLYRFTKREDTEAVLNELILTAEKRGEERITPRKGSALETVTNWLKQYPEDTQVRVQSSDTGLVITHIAKEK